MAEARTIARPYAKALFEDALQHEQLAPWSQVLEALALIISNPCAAEFCLDPERTGEQVQKFLIETLEKSVKKEAKQLSDKPLNLIKLLIENDRLMVLPQIDALFAELMAAHQAIIKVEVVYAQPVAAKQLKRIQTSLEKRFNQAVKLELKEDPTLIGGILLRAGDWVMDGSIRSRLNKLDENMTAS